VPSSGVVVRSGTIGAVRSAIMFSDGGVVVMGTIEVTTLHPSRTGSSELAPSPKVVSSSSKSLSRDVCKDGDPMCTIPTKIAPKSSPKGERLRRPKLSVVNSRLPKQVSPRASPTLFELLPLATKVSFSEKIIRTSGGKHAANPYSWRTNCWCFLH
jgi:hypothetical protein